MPSSQILKEMTSFYTKEHKGRIGIIKSAKLASFFHIFSPSLIHFSASILSSNLTGLLAFLSSPFILHVLPAVALISTVYLVSQQLSKL